MTILNPVHFFEQAEKLIQVSSGRPRQVDIRRAVSSAYYAVFHSTLTAAADEFVGTTNRSDPRYGLVYRSVDHKRLRELCEDVQKQTLPGKIRLYAPALGFDQNIKDYGAAVIDLQEKRHTADYNISVSVSRLEAAVAIRTAQTALARFNAAPASDRVAFLSLLLFQPR